MLGAIAGLLWLMARLVMGEDPATAVEKGEDKTKGVSAGEVKVEPPVRDLGEGRFQVGRVALDSKRKTITVPAHMHMEKGAVEYVLVTKSGKVHESVLVTDALPSNVHVAALLLGLSPVKDLGPEQAAAPLGKNGVVEIWLEWDGHGRVIRLPLTEAVMLADPASGGKKSTLPGGLWMYNGSRLVEGGFQADRGGSLVSIIRDPDALINNPGASRDNDEIHVPNAAKLPKLQTPVRVVMRVR